MLPRVERSHPDNKRFIAQPQIQHFDMFDLTDGWSPSAPIMFSNNTASTTMIANNHSMQADSLGLLTTSSPPKLKNEEPADCNKLPIVTA